MEQNKKTSTAKMRVQIFLLTMLATLGGGYAAFAQDGDDEPAALDIIIVTGQKIDRSLQETQASVGVITSEMIEESGGVSSLFDAARFVPNFDFNSADERAANIRGLDATGGGNAAAAFSTGNLPRATLYIDGVARSFLELTQGTIGLFDAEQIEFYRGVQSTIQGRNALAGAIVLKTADPTYEPEFKLRAMAGNFNTWEAGGVASLPIIQDQLAVRVAGIWRGQDNQITFTNPAVDFSNLELQEERYWSVRGKVLFEPAALDDLTLKFTFNKSRSERPQGDFATMPFFARDDDEETPSEYIVEPEFYILEANYDISDNFDLTLIGSISETSTKRRSTALPFGVDADQLADEKTFEALLNYSVPSLNATGVLGFYYFDRDQDEALDFKLPDFAGAGPSAFTDLVENYAVYGEVTFGLTDRLYLTLGGRLEREERERVGQVDLGAFGGIGALDFSRVFDSALPKVAVDYDLTDNVSVGGIVAKGKRAGAAGVNIILTPFEFDSEKLWNYELTFRSTWLGGRLTINANLFYQDFEDFQAQDNQVPGNDLTFIIVNADSAEQYGFELTAFAQVTDDLELYGSLGYVDTEYGTFILEGVDLAGNELPFAPNLTTSFGAIYSHPSGLGFSVDTQYTSDYFSDSENTAATKVDSRWVVNSQLSYEYKNVRLFVFARNLFDEDYLVQITDDLQFGAVGKSREWGVGIEASF